jgi:hypothetical protein
MKTASCLVTACVLVVLARADSSIDIYLTKASSPGGQVMAADGRWLTDECDLNPYFVPPPTALPHSPFTQPAGTTETYYLWADMTIDPTATPSVDRLTMYAIGLSQSHVTGSAAIGQNLFYRDTSASGTPIWTTTGPVPFPGSAQSLGDGLVTDRAPDMLEYVEGNVTHALLGVFELSSPAGVTDGKFYLGGNIVVAAREYTLELTPAPHYVVIHDYHSGPDAFYPHLKVQGVPYPNGSGEPQLAVAFVPEPTGMLLLSTASLLLRRR